MRGLFGLQQSGVVRVSGSVVIGLAIGLAFATPGWAQQNCEVTGNMVVDGTTGIGTQSPGFSLDIQKDGAAASVVATGFAAAQNVGYGRFVVGGARGSQASPSVSQANDSLGMFGGRSYGATGFSVGSMAAVVMWAAENWTATAQGTYLTLATTATGSTQRLDRLRVNASGRVSIGNTNDTEILDVTGNVNASGVLKVGGTAGLTKVVTVRNSAGTANCAMTFTGGILTATTCSHT